MIIPSNKPIHGQQTGCNALLISGYCYQHQKWATSGTPK